MEDAGPAVAAVFDSPFEFGIYIVVLKPFLQTKAR